MPIVTGQKGRASDFITAAERDTGTPANDSGKVPQLEADGLLSPDFLHPILNPIVQVYEASKRGSSTTQFDVTKSGSTVRYTWDGTGTNPIINTGSLAVGAQIFIDMNYGNNATELANNGLFTVTSVGTDYFEVTNAGGVAQNNVTIGALGCLFFIPNYTWTKPGNIKYAIVEEVGGGAGGYHSNGTGSTSLGPSGGGAEYTKKLLLNAALSTVSIGIGTPGRGGFYSGTNPTNGGDSSFGGLATAKGGLAPTGASLPGISKGGICDLSVPGEDAEEDFAAQNRGGRGGDSHWGQGGRGKTGTGQGNPGQAPGGGGSAGRGNAQRGGWGYPGKVIVYEFY